MMNYNQSPNRPMQGITQSTSYYHENGQAPTENFSVFEHLQNQSQGTTSKQTFNQSPMSYYPQQQSQLQQQQLQPPQLLLQQQQQEVKKKKPLNAKAKNFQNPPSSHPRFPSLTSVESTYDSSTDVTLSSVATESVIGTGTGPTSMNSYPIEHLDVTSFKLKPCPHNTQHNHKQCPYYHNSKDRKRPENFYSSDLCDFAEAPENCPNGDACTKAHNRVEQLYKQEKYKTKFCGHYPNNLHLCEYGTFCSFAHSEQDITIDLIHNYEYDDDFYMFHFKTVWCPFNLSQHDKALCVYAHNWQDYRRKPHVFSYEPMPCPNWKSTDFIVNYEDGCYLKEKCNKCHGWKELEYHPLNYKTKHCPSKNCTKGRDCPHYHYLKERRAITMNIANRVFKLVPKNRIVTGTFKKRKEDVSGAPGLVKSFSTVSANEEMNTSLDTGISYPVGLGSINELPPQEQLKWMNTMIQNMMAAHSLNDEGLKIDTGKQIGSHKRRSSVDSPYFGDKKKPEPNPPVNYHIASLFGDPQKRKSSEIIQPMRSQQYSQEIGSNDYMFRTILESPMKRFVSRSVQEIQDPQPQQQYEGSYPSHEDQEDGDF